MKAFHSLSRYAGTLLLCCIICLPSLLWSQTYNFRTREASVVRTAPQIKAHNGLPDTIIVRQDKWDEIIAAGSGWGANLKFKSVHAFVKFYVNHAYPVKIMEAYTFRLAYRIYGYSNMADTTAATSAYDTLTVSYKPDSLAAFQDLQYKKYSNFHKIMIVLTNLYAISDASSPPVELDLDSTGIFSQLNFNVEGSILVQPYHKKVKVGSSYVSVYGSAAPAMTIGAGTATQDYLPVRWNISGASLSDNLEMTPANYELEWTYIDNYKVDPGDGSISTQSASNLQYNFRNNSTRIWLDTNYYRIPLIYQKGYLLYRIRMVRPDSTAYRYPVYGAWTMAEQGTVSGAASSGKYEISQAHLSDSLNWQYTVSFAEQGKYKHVMSYYDGMLKNRQSITRFNSMPGKLIATEQVYDFEGRPSISILPTPVISPAFRYQYDLTLNAATDLPYKARDFDTLQLAVCPLDNIPARLADSAKANIYYSPANPDKAGFQKFVPDAGGYPFMQTIYSPGYDERVEKQGGAGDSLQIGRGHNVKNDYVSADQGDLNRLFGIDIGWSGFYRKTVSRDPNGQLSLNVTDYKGKTMASSMIGVPDTLLHALVANTNAADTSFFMEDHIAGTAQQIMGNKRILDKNFFNDAGGNNLSCYIYSFKPFPTFCENKYLSVEARYDYSIFDECGTLKVDTGGVLGTTGMVDDPAPVTDSSAWIPFYMDKGKHSLHKELTINTDAIGAAVDNFMTEALKPEVSCLKTEPWFIRQSVLSREFPCPEEYIYMDCRTCRGMKYQMMQELWPNKDSVYTVRKYGVYERDHGTVIGNGNSIFTLYCGMGGNPLDWDILITPDSFRGPAGSGGDLIPGWGSGTYQLGGGNFGPGLQYPGYIVNSNSDTLHCRYRYQDTCLVHLPQSVTRFGHTYTDLQSLPVDTFIYIFNDSIAEALLPLHPEYCKLLECYDDDYKDKLQSIPDADIAMQLGLATLTDMILQDPLYTQMALMPADYPSPFDTLAYSQNGVLSLDTLAMIQAYCNCQDSSMFAECMNHIFQPQISGFNLADPYVQQRYFETIKGLYIGNRARYLFNMSEAAGLGGCSTCIHARMELVPLPVFTDVFDANGMATGPGSFLDNAQLIDTSAGSLINQYYTLIQQVSLADTLAQANDSAVATYNANVAALCEGAANQIIVQLVNCSDSSTLSHVRDSLLWLCHHNMVPPGGYRPEQIRWALTGNGITLDDLCNPYLVNYDQTMDYNNQPQTGAFICNNDAFYYDANITMNGSYVAESLKRGTSYASMPLNLSNQFEQALADELGSSFVALSRESTPGMYTLSFSHAGDTVKFYFKVPFSGACRNAFSEAMGESVSMTIGCINSDFPGFAKGYIGKFAFATHVYNDNGSTVSECILPCWNNKIAMNNTGENPIANCIPCTQMRTLYNDLWDTLKAYKVKGVNHPYYNTMLRNFMNLKLRKAYTAGQYTDFVQSCALADSMQIDRYVGYIHIGFNLGGYADDFIDTLNSFDSAVHVDVQYRYRTGGERLSFNLDGIPKNKLRKTVEFINNYYAGVNVKYINILDAGPTFLGYLWIPDTSSFVPDDAIFGYAPSSLIFEPETIPIEYRNQSSVAYRSFGRMNVYKPNTNTFAETNYNVHLLQQYIYEHCPACDFYPAIETTVNQDYNLTDKQAYLQYTYGMQGRPANKVLDQLQADSLLVHVGDYSGKQLSYGHPAQPGNIQNVYIGDPAKAKDGTQYEKLSVILDQVYHTLPDSALFFTGVNSLNIPVGYPAGAQLMAYRCSDKAFWYRYFGDGDTLFNAFIRIPAYIDTNFLPTYKLRGWTYNLGEGNSYSFKVFLHSDVAQVPDLSLDGFTDFTVAHNEILHDVLLTHAVNEGMPLADTINNCERNRLNNAIVEGKIRYGQYIDSLRGKLYNDFYAYVMSGGVQEKLYVGYKNQRFNYTLYYYDRAGNLIKTVPPAGVAFLGGSFTPGVDTQRAGNSVSSLFQPGHHKPSRYYYNTLNQVAQQETPDGGRSEYFYDAAGRAIFSQNAKQRGTGRMAYTLYDKQGRIAESGQALLACPNYFVPYKSPNVIPPNNCGYYVNGMISPFPAEVYNLRAYTHEQVAAYVRSMSREEVVVTHYDTAAFSLNGVKAWLSPQDNLRKRVSCIKYFDYLPATDAAFTHYDYAMHFSYDIAGNVKTLTRDYPGWAINDQQFKRVDYDYDVISGKVNMLSYNRSFADQYYQRYNYDADNRITAVETSADGYIWKRDAAYSYYQHGPLARMSLGDLRVQGADYAYTIQGWLKALNGDMLDTVSDIGADAAGNSIHAKDAVALTLDYFQGDYRPIGSTPVTHIAATGKNLYNGNIPRASTAIAPFPALNTRYTYDQLNRIVQAQYAYVNPYTAAMSNTSDYFSSYAYDADGNLQQLVRNAHTIGGASQLMDSLEYHYQNWQNNNRLSNVTDNISNNSFPYDIKHYTNTGASRYLYDATGNTIKDLVSGQDTIQWNHYNKVIQTRNDSMGNGLRFAYDGAGNRFMKTQTRTSGDTTMERSDYYVRDAQGNILAVYKADDHYKMTRTEWIEYITHEFIREYTLEAFLHEIVRPHYAHNGYFSSAVMAIAQANVHFAAAAIAAHPVSFYVEHNTAVKSNILAHAGDYKDFYLELQQFSASHNLPVLGSALYSELRPETIDNINFLKALLDDKVQEDTLKYVLQLLCDHTDSLFRNTLIRMGLGWDTTACVKNVDMLADRFKTIPDSRNEFPETMGSLVAGGLYDDDYWSFIRTLSLDERVLGYNKYTRPDSSGLLIGYFQDALHNQAGDSVLGAFLDTWAPADSLMKATTATPTLLQVAYDYDVTGFLDNYITTVSSGEPDIVNLGLTTIPWLSVTNLMDKWKVYNPVDTVIHTVYKNVLASRRVSLAEHDLYGSSRLGTKNYLPGQYYMYWDYSGADTLLADTATLSARRPWFSLEYNDDVSGLALQPWSMTELESFVAGHQLGQKQYELTNHLGNVQATISDYPAYWAAGSGDTIRMHHPALVTAYDYYPFGMLMPGRGTDSLLAVSNVQGNLLVEATDFSDGTAQGWTYSGSLSAGVENGRLRVSVGGPFHGVWRSMDLVAGRSYRLRINTDQGTVADAMNFTLVSRPGGSLIRHQYVPAGSSTIDFSFTAPENVAELYIETWGYTLPGINQQFYIDNFLLEEIIPQPEVAPVTNGGCVTMTQSKWVQSFREVCYDATTWIWSYYKVTGGGTVSISSGHVEISVPDPGDAISFEMEATAGYLQELNVDVFEISSGTPTLQVAEEINGNWVNLTSSVLTHTGITKLTFIPHRDRIRVTVGGPAILKTNKVCIYVPVLKQENVLVTICPDDNDHYRFGFNGQEKVNEWAGLGNYVDFGARGLDTRINRWLAPDPAEYRYPKFSTYSSLGNNPIFFTDPDGGRIYFFQSDKLGSEMFANTLNKEIGTKAFSISGGYLEVKDDKSVMNNPLYKYMRDKIKSDKEIQVTASSNEWGGRYVDDYEFKNIMMSQVSQASTPEFKGASQLMMHFIEEQWSRQVVNNGGMDYMRDHIAALNKEMSVLGTQLGNYYAHEDEFQKKYFYAIFQVLNKDNKVSGYYEMAVYYGDAKAPMVRYYNVEAGEKRIEALKNDKYVGKYFQKILNMRSEESKSSRSNNATQPETGGGDKGASYEQQENGSIKINTR